MPEERLNMRLDPQTKHDLEQLARRLNLTYTAVVRMVLREAAEQRGIPLLEETNDGSDH